VQAGPAPDARAGATLSLWRDEAIVVFGGRSAAGLRNDAWVLDFPEVRRVVPHDFRPVGVLGRRHRRERRERRGGVARRQVDRRHPEAQRRHQERRREMAGHPLDFR